jgi:hypothetical protein
VAADCQAAVDCRRDPSEGFRPVAVRLQSLPAPDVLEVDLPEGHVCLVADDGSDTGAALIARLRSLGWGTVPVCLDGQNEAEVQAALSQVRAEHGPVGAFIYLHPRRQAPSHLGEILEPKGRAQLSTPFLAAKHLHQDLVAAAALGHTFFVTVTLLDGSLGLDGGSVAADPVGGGIAGLTKTLRLEWPEVFCRAIDLDPRLGAETAAEAIVAELRDPNRLVAEVGYSARGRVTLVTRPDGGQPW